MNAVRFLKSTSYIGFKKINLFKRPKRFNAPGPDLVPVAVGVIVESCDGDCRVLITRRRPDSVLGGYWEFPGGKIEPGETAQQCVAREIYEELGFCVRVDQPLLAVEHVYPHGRVRLEPYYCTRLSGQLRHIEVAEHRWVTPEQLHDYRFPRANRKLLERLVTDLSG